MTLNEYQELAQRTSRTDMAHRDHIFNGVMGLCGEAGEVIDLVKKHAFQDGREIKNALRDELGDVMWYIAETASAVGLSMEEIAEYNISKLRRRYPDGFAADRSMFRDEDPEV